MTRYDIAVIGGGITGAGIARDAAARGMSVALFEKNDYASGTSSKSSKLVHGGLRYLEHGEIGLVFESVSERRIQTRVAPHLVRPVAFLYPLTHRGWERPYVTAGLTLYDTMARAGRYDVGLPRHKHLSRRGVQRVAPDLAPEGMVSSNTVSRL